MLNATWNYTDPHNPSLAEVAREINGRAVADVTDEKLKQTIKAGQQLAGLRVAARRRLDRIAATGSTADRWTEAGAMMQRRGTDDPSGLGIYPNWAWSWPANRRVLYNRASCDRDGRAVGRGPQAGLVERSAAALGGQSTCRTSKLDSPPKDHMGPFIMNPEGVGRLFAPLAVVRRWAVPRALRAHREPDW